MISKKNTENGVVIEGYQVRLRPVASTDLDTLRTWRNSEFVARQMLSTAHISEAQQQQWFTTIAALPSQQHWVVEYRDKPIGATNVKSADGETAVEHARVLEPGLYIGDPAYQGNILAFAPTLALYDYCFGELGTARFRAVVKADNLAALKYNRQLGYDVVSEGELVELHLHADAYQRQTSALRQLLSRPRSNNKKRG
ncbi:GNAT family N-acetyltransferase [Alteromonas sp. CYL-A6]|uniref:GNAT family N-acetyltransferase n=1 Tax=Alteromonas nitratireducens TaxID=3390813 RepID=UPI0034BD89EF